MVGSLKTTFDIPEPLLRDVQKLARERNTTTESLVEQALRKLLAERAQDRRRSKPRPDTGLAGIAVAAVAERGWPRLTRNYRTVRTLLTNATVRGPMVHDARLAAIRLDHGMTELLTMDRDFSRFPLLRTRSLLA
ncbi:MAG TPA: hypothetical protein VHS54_08180 [Jatrophihabitans sp.]|jgi:predicted nucleic acid-binding protein|nr:hypothetical protein [Jatrophihabitans sp.]